MTAKALIQLEYAKWKNNSVMIILSLLYVIMLPSVLALAKELRDLPPPMSSNQTFFIFPTVWDWVGYAGNWLSFFCLGLISIFLIVNEVSYKTFRQNIITGMTRKDYFKGKVLSIAVISAAATLYYSFICLTSGFLHTSNPEISFAFDNSYAIPRYFLMTFGYMSLALFIAVLIRRSGVSVLLYLIYVLMIEPALKWGVHFKLLNNPTINFYPVNVIEDLQPLPLFRLPAAFSNMVDEINFNLLLSYSTATIASMVWIAIFLGLAYQILERRDM